MWVFNHSNCYRGDVMMNKVDKQALREAELENDELRQKLANAEHQLYMAELAKHNLRASRKAQFRKRRAAEKRVSELEKEIANLKAKALYWDADNTESSYEDPVDIANDLDLNPGDHFYVQVAYLDQDMEYVVNDDGSVSRTKIANC